MFVSLACINMNPFLCSHAHTPRACYPVMNNLHKGRHQVRVRRLHLVKTMKMKEHLRFKVRGKGEECLWGQGCRCASCTVTYRNCG